MINKMKETSIDGQLRMLYDEYYHECDVFNKEMAGICTGEPFSRAFYLTLLEGAHRGVRAVLMSDTIEDPQLKKRFKDLKEGLGSLLKEQRYFDEGSTSSCEYTGFSENLRRQICQEY